MDEYYCPNCDAILNDQPGFNPDDNMWTCTSCGTRLFDEDAAEGERLEDIFWVCDKCGASLSSQPGFSDSYQAWACYQCGYVNRISEDDILEEGAEFDHSTVPEDAAGFWDYPGKDEARTYDRGVNDDDDDKDVVDDDDDDDDDWSTSHNEESEYAEESSASQSDENEDSSSVDWGKPAVDVEYAEREKQRKRREFAKSHWRVIAFLCCLVIVAIAGLLAYAESQNYHVVAMSSDDAIGQPYETVVEKFKEAGFTEITSKGLNDLRSSELDDDGKVDSISIADNATFNATERFRYDSPIVVTYHSIRLAYPPLTRKEAKGKDYREIVQQFKDAGFENVRVEGQRDALIGVIRKTNTVKSVTIDGDKKYKKDQGYRVDCEVVVYYHEMVFG